jgi:hypothetical protein
MKKTSKILLFLTVVFIAAICSRCRKENRVLDITYVNETDSTVHMYTGIEKSESDNQISGHSTLIDKFTIKDDETCLDFAVGNNIQTILKQNLCFGEDNTIKVYYNGVSLRLE